MIAKIFALLTLITVSISGLPFTLNKDNSSLLSEDGLFEGDIKISESLIRTHYNMSGMEELGQGNNRSKRSVANNVYLWTGGIVPYVISSSFSSSKQIMIRNAMNHWEDNTCLRFVPRRSSHRDYIYFVDWYDGCYSYVGRQIGGQIINLELNICDTYGVILHEIGHAIGFWHEQSRPDRDNYVSINYGNIELGWSSQFMKRNDFDIDYQGSSYDYGSIMHYPDTAFVKDNCPGCKTIEVSNNATYIAQGSPTLGQRNDLSNSDIQQMNRLYACSGSGLYGILTIKVRYGRNLKDTDGILNLSDPLVEIIAVDSSGTHYFAYTTTKYGTLNPVWDKTFRSHRGYWQFFRFRVWDEDYYSYEAMSMSETVIIRRGSHTNQKHCHDTRCSGYIRYDYSLV